MRQPRRFSKILLVLVLAIFALAIPSFGQISLPAGATGIHTPTAMQSYTSSCPLWRTDNTFQSTIRLTNMLADRQLEHQPNPDVWHGAKVGPARRRAALRGVRHHLSVQYQHAGGERQPWHRPPSRLPGEDEERQFYDDPDVPAQWCRFRDLRADLVRWVVVGLRCDV